MASSGLNGLPDDIIIAIATQLKWDINSNTNLLAFILVTKRWYQLGLQSFYGNIALGIMNLEQFTRSFVVSAHGNYVRSLTLRIEAGRGICTSAQVSVGSDNAGDKTKTSNGVARLVSLIPHFKNLVSFSLRLEESRWCPIPRATIIALLGALPESCTNLELDTFGQDHRKDNEQAHVCDAVRCVLPRMQNVRIRLGAMCGAMFGTGKMLASSRVESDSADGTIDDFAPISLPKIQSLIVYCALPSGTRLQRCGRTSYTPLAMTLPWLASFAYPSITTSLAKLVEQNIENLRSAQIYAMVGNQSSNSTQDCQTEIRIDMVAKEAWAFPSLPLGKPLGNLGYIVRLHNESEFVTTKAENIEAIAEGQLWKDTLGGTRLSVQILDAAKNGLPSFAAGCVESRLPTKTVEEWTMENQCVEMPVVWRNEEKAGMKLMFAEKRTGDGYLSGLPVKEITPEGWIRTGHGFFIDRP